MNMYENDHEPSLCYSITHILKSPSEPYSKFTSSSLLNSLSPLDPGTDYYCHNAIPQYSFLVFFTCSPNVSPSSFPTHWNIPSLRESKSKILNDMFLGTTILSPSTKCFLLCSGWGSKVADARPLWPLLLLKVWTVFFNAWFAQFYEGI